MRKLFLAGQSCDIPQNKIMRKLFLAGQNGRTEIINNLLINENFFSGKRKSCTSLLQNYCNWGGDDEFKFKPFILESFYYMSKDFERLIPYLGDFLLDSGAFTFMNNFKGKINWDEYVERYAKFINKHNVKHFFELDIDVLVGIQEVERLRNKLEKLTNKKSIPVWHKSRGLEYWKKMCKEYDYIAIGGIVTREIKSKDYNIFIPLLKIAEENNCKVHGLGFTNLDGIKKYKFYSVDSTSWTTGNRFGHLYKFNGNTIIKINKPKGSRCKPREVAVNNFLERMKFSHYLFYNS